MVRRGEEEGRWERERHLPVLVTASRKGEGEEEEEEKEKEKEKKEEGSYEDLRCVCLEGDMSGYSLFLE